ncbi:hypothetical protein Tcan_07720 [Toxocara canis]|uniref:Uncharacterized protein n=1 Tax=Toxocara canis TaxID=6265 RepID=A0A0B2UUI2_TOXCA|nr:hypothetical protein Tcan_07720 [Toxocara canis]
MLIVFRFYSRQSDSAYDKTAARSTYSDFAVISGLGQLGALRSEFVCTVKIKKFSAHLHKHRLRVLPHAKSTKLMKHRHAPHQLNVVNNGETLTTRFQNDEVLVNCRYAQR